MTDEAKESEVETPNDEQTRCSSHCSTASENAVVQEQLRFVEWLKQRGMYSEYASANEMRKMHAVWKRCQEDNTVPAADDDAIRGGWTLSPSFLGRLSKETETNDRWHAGMEQCEAVIMAMVDRGIVQVSQ